ncbi:hypothetical protein KIW84_061713, partial [Lathyrus oleraceus]
PFISPHTHYLFNQLYIYLWFISLLFKYSNNNLIHLIFPYFHNLFTQQTLKYKENLLMAATATATAGSFSMKGSKVRSLGRYSSKQVRQQRARLYIIWRCTVLLLCWND